MHEDAAGGMTPEVEAYLRAARERAAVVAGARPGTRARTVTRIGVVGAGTMGTGIAMSALAGGFPVRIVERDDAALARGLAIVAQALDARVAKGRLTPEARADQFDRLASATDLGTLADCDLIIEAAYEDLAVKQALFRELDAIAPARAVLATNTSFLDVDRIAAATRRPDAVVGMHFFSPAHVMKLLEVVRGARTADDVLETALATGRALGKVTVVAGVCHGFIGNRMSAFRQQQAYRLLLEGATPAQVDAVLERFGMPMGPLRMADLAGLDLGWTRETSKGETVKEVLCEAGRRGQKAGRGFYDYGEDRVPRPSAEADAIIAALAARQGIARRPIDDDEIFERCLYPMINEGARILAEGKAQSASDIDMVWINGFGWPAWRGGPMYWAVAHGLPTIVDRLEARAAQFGDAFRLSPLLCDLARTGRPFSTDPRPLNLEPADHA